MQELPKEKEPLESPQVNDDVLCRLVSINESISLADTDAITKDTGVGPVVAMGHVGLSDDVRKEEQKGTASNDEQSNRDVSGKVGHILILK